MKRFFFKGRKNVSGGNEKGRASEFSGKGKPSLIDSDYDLYTTSSVPQVPTMIVQQPPSRSSYQQPMHQSQPYAASPTQQYQQQQHQQQRQQQQPTQSRTTTGVNANGNRVTTTTVRLPPPPSPTTSPPTAAKPPTTPVRTSPTGVGRPPPSPPFATAAAAAASPTEPPEDKTTALTRDLVKKFIADIWNRGEVDLIPSVCSPSLRFNGNTGFDRVGHDGLARMVGTIREALDDYHCEIHSMVVEHNKAFCRLRFTGKHTGKLLGFEPTNRVVAWMGATEFTCQNGKILKVWELGDVKSLEEQISGEAPSGGLHNDS